MTDRNSVRGSNADSQLVGRFLRAAETVSPAWTNSVIAIFDCVEGAHYGVIANRISTAPLRQVPLAEMYIPEGSDRRLYEGGPAPGAIILAHFRHPENLAHLISTGAPDLNLPRSFFGEGLGAIMPGLEDPGNFKGKLLDARCYLGLSAWAPNQLEGELETGMWSLADEVTSAVLFGGPVVT